MLIKVSNLTYNSGSFSILENVSLSLNEHDFITIVGPNGAGKSTLLKCIIGAYKVEPGVIIKRSGIRIGYVPQNLNTQSYIPLKVLNFLSLKCLNDSEFFDKIIYELKIQHVLNKHLLSLSGGELRRVLIARAILVRPSVLILDEPVQNLDVTGQVVLYNLLERIYRDLKLSIIMVSHDLRFVMSSTKNVICLFKHICCSGKPEIISKDPKFTSLFGDEFARITAFYSHAKHDHKH